LFLKPPEILKIVQKVVTNVHYCREHQPMRKKENWNRNLMGKYSYPAICSKFTGVEGIRE
jgi:hypothetical protein